MKFWATGGHPIFFEILETWGDPIFYEIFVRFGMERTRRVRG